MSDLDENALDKVDNELRERYSSRLREFGSDPRTLGWDTRANQEARFAMATKCQSTKGRSILDVGCGLADLNKFLESSPLTFPSGYQGMDINPDLIESCRQRFENREFFVGNLLSETPSPNSSDIVCLFGLLNFKFDEFENVVFAKNMIRAGFSVAKEALIVDMLSMYYDSTYPKEDFVYYYNPLEMMEFALSLTPHVQIRHDYASLPQREFMMILRKEPCR